MKKNTLATALAVACLSSLILACSALSGAPSLPDVPSLPGSSGDRVLLQDDFSDDNSGWGTGTDSQSSVEYVNGGLQMTSFKDNFFTWSNPDTNDYQDVHMEVTVENNSGGIRTGFGILCDQQVVGSSYYYFVVTSDGQYAIAEASLTKDDVFLTNNDDWADSSLIPQNADTYRIGADCGNGALTLYVNGNQIDSVTDDTYTKGNVGVFLWAGDTISGGVTYDDFVMTALK